MVQRVWANARRGHNLITARDTLRNHLVYRRKLAWGIPPPVFERPVWRYTK